MLTKYKLALSLSKLEGPSNKYRLLQLSLSPVLAADILSLAKRDIKNKIVYNLGCGTGRFAIGSALLGAKEVYGIDLDRTMLDMARENMLHVQHLTGIHLNSFCNWQMKDALKLKEGCDTVIQFPPINTDVLFFIKALEIASNIYSIHKPDREEELKQLARKYKARIAKVKKYKLKRGILPEVILVVAKR